MGIKVTGRQQYNVAAGRKDLRDERLVKEGAQGRDAEQAHHGTD